MRTGQFQTSHKMSFRPDLQGLRAIAIVLVILDHSRLGVVTGGFIGVDIFFVLSGYLITGLLLREYENTGRIDLPVFYARRLRRLLPALACMLAGAALLTVCLLSGHEARQQLLSGPYAASWTSNLYFTWVSLDYFDELASRDLFLHTWSLGVEEQFYLIWPIMILLMLRLMRWRHVDSRQLRAGLLLIVVASLLLSFYWTNTRPEYAFYLMPARIWQLALGALVYAVCRYAHEKKTLITPRSGTLIQGTGLLLIGFSAYGLHPGLAYPGYLALLPATGAALVIAAGHERSGGFRNPLSHPFLVWIGDRSYSLYLWHWPIMMLGFSLGLQGQVLLTLNLVLMVLFAAILSYRLVEVPFWKGRFSTFGHKTVLTGSLLVIVTIVAAFYHGLHLLPQTEPPRAPRADFPIIYRMGCDAWFFHARVEPCIIGPADASRTVVMLGDSHGAQWYSLLPEIYPVPDWRIMVLTKSSCPLVDHDYFYPRIGKVYQVCTEWRNAVLEELDRIRPDTVIAGSASTYGFTRDDWIDGSGRIFERLGRAAGQVIVIAGTPQLNFDGPGCVERNLTPQGNIDPNACLARDRMYEPDKVSDYLRVAAAPHANVHILDLNDLVCPDDICRAVSATGQIIYRDSQHLTDSFVRSLIPQIRQRIFATGP